MSAANNVVPNCTVIRLQIQIFTLKCCLAQGPSVHQKNKTETRKWTNIFIITFLEPVPGQKQCCPFWGPKIKFKQIFPSFLFGDCSLQ